MSATCRSCGAPIVWAVTMNDKRMPLDAEPEATGLFHLVQEDDGTLRAVSIGAGHVSHFATCPNANQHRKPREATTA